jgi:hypothetical protein
MMYKLDYKKFNQAFYGDLDWSDSIVSIYIKEIIISSVYKDKIINTKNITFEDTAFDNAMVIRFEYKLKPKGKYYLTKGMDDEWLDVEKFLTLEYYERLDEVLK